MLQEASSNGTQQDSTAQVQGPPSNLTIDRLPQELLFQICTELDYDDLLGLGLCSKYLQLFVKDVTLQERLLMSLFPLAHARYALQSHSTSRQRVLAIGWTQELKRCADLQRRCMRRKLVSYLCLDTETLSDSSAEIRAVDTTSRSRVFCNWGKVAVLTGTAENEACIRVLTLSTGKVVSCLLPEAYQARDVAIAVDGIHVLTTRAAPQWVFSFDDDGMRQASIEIQTQSVHTIAASSSRIVVGDMQKLWFEIQRESGTVMQLPSPWEAMLPEEIDQQIGSLLCAADENFFYLSHTHCKPRCWSFIDRTWKSLAPPLVTAADQTFFSSANGFVYAWFDDRLHLIHGSDTVAANGKMFLPADDDRTWAIYPLFDLGGFVEWQGDTDTVNFGLYGFVGREGRLKEYGRLRGCGEPDEHREMRNVLLLGDHQWLVLADMTSRQLHIWRLCP